MASRILRMLLSGSMIASVASITHSEEAAAAQSSSQTFHIPAQPLGQALREYSRRTREQIVFSEEAVRGVSSPALRGSMSKAEALARLLAGTGLQASRTASGVITIRAQSSADVLARQPVSTTVLPAQSGDAIEPETAEATNDEPIVITGSRIQRANLRSPNPITSVTGEELLNTGDLSIGDSLNELPSLKSTFGSGPSAKGLGTAGLNLLDLRGLGLERTLVLVNGRRHITGLVGSYYVDVSTIPSELVERVDVVTGGSSAVYGSDAIAGVVNFILRRNFDGVSARAQAGTTGRGGRESHLLAMTAGKNFADDRGNIAVSAEYSHQNALTYADREDITGAFLGRVGYQQTDVTAGEPATGDGIPDFTLERDLFTNNISYGGMFQGAQDFFAFDREGNLRRSVCTKSFAQFGGSTACVGGLGVTTRETLQLLPNNTRFVANLLGHYDFSDAARVFVEAKYVKGKNSLVTSPFTLAPSFSINNPFLTDQARATILSERPGSTTFTVRRFFSDLGTRREDLERDTFRIVGGVEGRFNGDWRYEVAANYGEIKIDQLIFGFPLTTPLNNATNAVRNAQGQIVCGINADASTTNDDPACVPINLFGEGRASPAALAYVSRPLTRSDKGTEWVLSGYVSGDFSQLFELPGGPIGFALGAEYRKETAATDWDTLIETNQTVVGMIPDFAPPAFEVKELFGELNAPILRDLPFAHELSLSAALRMSDYKGGTGTVWAYNFGAIYAPVPDLRLRANYSRSVRAPTLTDLYQPQFVFTVNFQDPCDVNNIGNGPNRAKNCAAAGLPPDFVNGPARVDRLAYTAGGNPDLHEETSDGYTLGLVFVPSFMRGFSLSADYYNIAVAGVISKLGPGGVISSCYDSPTGLDNPFCPLVKRLPNGLFDPASAVLDVPINFAALKTSGIDIDAAYRRDLGDVRLDMRALASYIIFRDVYFDPVNADFRDRSKSEVGSPAFEATLATNLDFGVFNFGYKLRYLGRQTNAAYEAQHSVDGRPPANPDQFEKAFLPARLYHDVTFAFDINENFTFYGGIDNLLDSNPPLGRIGDNSGEPWDVVGRYFFAGAKVNF